MKMRTSYNEFHISAEIRHECGFDSRLYASTGNVVLANMKSVRSFALLLNGYFDRIGDGNKKISAGQLNAMGLIDEILHHVCMLYRRDRYSDFMEELVAELERALTKEKFDRLLLEFTEKFPPVEVFQKKCTAEEYLSRVSVEDSTGKERTNRAQTVEEIIMLRLANENPAFRPFSVLFDDSALAENPSYGKAWAVIEEFASEKPVFGPFDHDLISLLKEPMVFAPDSLKDQLDYIQKHWSSMLGEWIRRLLAGMDTISEEEKAAWQPLGGGAPWDGPDMQPYSYENLMNEYERYSADSDWMPKVVLMAKTVLVWLDQLTKKYGYPITRLDQIPDAELDALRDEGFTGLWLIGLWERSKASRRIKQLCGNPEAAASAYSLYDYNIAQNIGGWDALSNLRVRLWQRGIRLASDMVPNHTGMDSDWVINRPDLFVQRRDNPFPQYTYNGENLSQDGRVGIYLEDHYYSKSDCAVVFKRVDNQTGDTRYIYHGNDGTGLPWNDTAQIDFLNPQAREAVIQEILHVARNFPIIRFDAAMVLAKKHIRRLWYPEPGHGGDIATRSETGLSTQQFNDAIPNEFWREVVDRVAKEVPDTLLLAEAFWMMEGYFVRTLGMHRVYNSAFMNMLKKEENQKYRETVKNTITFDPQVLKRYVNFMNNPDEETAIAQFGDGDKYFGVCTLMVTMPGLPMFGHGQIEGFTEKYGMEYMKAYKDEKPNEGLLARHRHDIFPLMKKRYLFAGVENFLFYDLWENGHVNENVFAYSNGCGDERAVVFYNNKYERACGWIKQSDPYAVKTGNGDEVVMVTRSISEGLNLTAEDDKYTVFREHRSGLWYIRKSSEICAKGLFVALNGFEYQVLMDVRQVSDTIDHRYGILCETLNGKGCEDLESAWLEVVYKKLYADFAVFAENALKPLCALFFEEPEKDSDSADEDEFTEPTDEAVAQVLKDAEESALKFYASASDYYLSVHAVPKIPEAAELYRRFCLRIGQFARIMGADEIPAADRAKALAKARTPAEFAKILVQDDRDMQIALLCRALMSDFAVNGFAAECEIFRKFSCLLAEYKATFSARELLRKIFILSSLYGRVEDGGDVKKMSFRIVHELVEGRNAALLSGANCFDNVWWFNRETSDMSLALAKMSALLEADEDSVPEVMKLFRKIDSSKTKAAYRCALFVAEFSPKKRGKRETDSASRSAEKSVAVKKSSAGKKRTAGGKKTPEKSE